MAAEGNPAPSGGDLNPDSFMASQAAPDKHQAAEPSWWDRAKTEAEAGSALFTGLSKKAAELANTPLVPESVVTGPPSIDRKSVV